MLFLCKNIARYRKKSRGPPDNGHSLLCKQNVQNNDDVDFKCNNIKWTN